MVEEYVCDTCGKHLKTAAGLAGHKMLAHPPAKEPTTSGSPEQAVVEMLDSVREAYGRLEGRLDDFGSQFKSLVAQLSTVDGSLDGFQNSMLDRISNAEAAKRAAESDNEAVHKRLSQWEKGEAHHRLRALWDYTNGHCSDCAEDKAAIIAELRSSDVILEFQAFQEKGFYESDLGRILRDILHAISDRDWERLEAKGEDLKVLARVVMKGQTAPTATEAGDGAAASGSEAEALPGTPEAEAQAKTDAGKILRFRVMEEPERKLPFFRPDNEYTLPADVQKPKLGDETDDLDLAEIWRRAGWVVDEIPAHNSQLVAAPAPASTAAAPSQTPKNKVIVAPVIGTSDVIREAPVKRKDEKLPFLRSDYE